MDFGHYAESAVELINADLTSCEDIEAFLEPRPWVREQVQASGDREPTDLHLKLFDAVEPALIDEALRQVDGNRLVAARWLGLARATVRKLIRKHHPESAEPDED